MPETQKIPWKRLSAEATAIVASILLAFAIDAWWDNLSTSEDEKESLELIQRDLNSAIAQIGTFLDFASNASQKALSVYATLSRPGPYDRDQIHRDMLGVDRKTMRLPRAAYTELLSTGNLRVIRDRELRDAIVRFYARAELTELIIQKNNDYVLDTLLYGAYVEDGLLYLHAASSVGFPEVDRAHATINEQLGRDFRHAEDPMWKYAPDSPQWDKLRSVLINAAITYNISQNMLNALKDEAMHLETEIIAWLDAQ